MNRRVVRIVTGSVVVLALALGVSALFEAPLAAPNCLCPDIYAPVICSNGKTYPNACVASCQKAKNCVPTGGI